MKKTIIVMGIIIMLLSGALIAKKVYHVNISQILNPKHVIQNMLSTPEPILSASGLSVQTYAGGLTDPRVIIFDSKDTLLVSETSAGKIVALPDANQDGLTDKVITLVAGLNQPHGLALSDTTLFVAENNQVSSFHYDPGTFSLTDKKVILTLPPDGVHFTRSLLIKDGQLFTAVGSSCNSCREQDSHRAAILRSNLDGSNLIVYASGLRNSVFQTINPQTGDIWLTENGRDNLGDEVPPDEINILRAGANYGWPDCFGKNVADITINKESSCPVSKYEPSFIDIPAHSAPLGLSFFPSSWPTEFHGKLLVSFHGSWNKTVPTGYKLVAIDPETGKFSDLLTSVNSPQFIARPVDVKFNSLGQLFVSDDKLNQIIRVTP